MNLGAVKDDEAVAMRDEDCGLLYDDDSKLRDEECVATDC